MLAVTPPIIKMFFQRRNGHSNGPFSPDQCLTKMEHFCAYRERCPKEVWAKLAELGAEGEDAQQIFQALQGDNFFDEQRFAQAYAGGKFRNNHWGKIRIRLELQVRDIPVQIIHQALDSIEIEEYEGLLMKLIEKKWTQFAEDDRQRDKTAAALIRSGFEPELVFKNLPIRS
jgi:regulatory protein